MKPTIRRSNNSKSLLNVFLVSNKAFLMALIMFIIVVSMSDVFLTRTNIMNLLRQMSANCLIALGFTLVIGYAEIDLSVGSVVAFIGVIMAVMMKYVGAPVWLAIIVGLLTGVICGSINAMLISAFNLPAFIVTLATQSVFRGLVYIITDMTPINGLPEQFIVIGQGYWLGVPIPVYIMFFFILLSFFLADRTMFGRYVVAGGGNQEAAKACGISISKTRLGIYFYMGICATAAAVIMTGRTASAQVNAGTNMELDAIAAVVMGGTALSGGRINIIGTVFGALIIALTSNSLNLLGISSNFQVIAKGVLILLALVLDISTTNLLNRIREKQALATLGKNTTDDKPAADAL